MTEGAAERTALEALLAERRVATDAEARALASSLRLRILRVCLDEAHSNKEIAQALDKDPATILYHVRRLVDTGFLEALPARRGTRGSREVPYRATGKSWRLSTPREHSVAVQTFVEELALVPAEEVDTARLGLRMSAELKAEFDDRLLELLEEFRIRADAANTGAAWSIFYAMHPDPNRP